MRIIVFGGTFNPPHLGHQLMIEQVLSKTIAGQQFDQLWILPVGQHSFAKTFVSNQYRLEMINLMVEDIVSKYPDYKNKIRIEEYELERDEESQTFRTLEALSAKYPEHQFSFLIGSDNLEKFNLWNDYEAMLKKYQFYVYPRVGFDFTPFYQGMTALYGFPKMAVSSSKVRLALKNKSSLDGLLNAKVISYINDQELFS